MTAFVWRIDSKHFVHTRYCSSNLSVRQFINEICRYLDQLSETYTLEQLKGGHVPHCHLHNQQKINKETDEYKTLFGQLRKINNDLAEKRIQLEPQDILQVAFPNISDRFRGFGYILDNVFYLIYLDPYHKVYK